MDFAIQIRCRTGWNVLLEPGDEVNLWAPGSVLLGTIRAEILVRLLAHYVDIAKIQMALMSDLDLAGLPTALRRPPRGAPRRLLSMESKDWRETRRIERKSRRKA